MYIPKFTNPEGIPAGMITLSYDTKEKVLVVCDSEGVAHKFVSSIGVSEKVRQLEMKIEKLLIKKVEDKPSKDKEDKTSESEIADTLKKKFTVDELRDILLGLKDIKGSVHMMKEDTLVEYIMERLSAKEITNLFITE